ncbi:MAG: KEOPS complex subunit Cgi121 [Salinirussus sp.]
MEVVAGRVTVSDVDEFVQHQQAIAADHDAMVQAFDARYIVDREHLEQAVTLANRAIERGEAIADDPAVEVLCYAAGTRQIEDALEIGISPGESRVVLVIDGGDETTVATSIANDIDTDPTVLGDYDRDLVRAFYNIGDAELGATAAGLPALVRERVALLSVER